ncbi:TetR/AcrR family transcriptional regulator [Microbacterium sp. ET2]|uniref:TetR/AcrR family transcriptional regulator n=1 Tax=Microbacterium albipurpureum TaxID=3050384 RepID=UPI00259CF9B6|nr:TetR/AcrR family transcriptional regulator [Microbacterium sp. ET2 (Ac-2212)]WJL94701.1 TetR/AcrR family transcriptional regulator [Microbacterium sp. ET2 (Ac-2212)]
MADDASPAASLRERLLAAALTELETVGADKLTVRGVARRAGVSHAAPGYEFGGRDGLVTALAARGFLALREALLAAPKRPGTSPADRLVALGRVYIDFAASHPGLFAVMFEDPTVHRTDPDYRAAAGPALTVLSERLADDLLVEPMVAWALAHGVATLLRAGAFDGTDVDATVRVERILTQFASVAGRQQGSGDAAAQHPSESF